mmetsp:Transcript_33999/g.30779  ORF Transcript_33999/g.30779 Transcript_33999/m.30779 type:complete len:244 (-) Transcript_33999:50-781(-)
MNAEIPLAIPLLKLLLGKTLAIPDLEDIEEEYESFQLMAKYPEMIEDISHITVVKETNAKGEIKEFKVVENYEKDEYTAEDVNKFLKKRYEYEMNKIKRQAEAFKKGFHSFMPLVVVNHLSCFDLFTIVNGCPEISAENLLKYCNFFDSGKTKDWMIELFKEFDSELRSKFLMFVTGSNRLSIDEPSDSNMVKIRFYHSDEYQLPKAATCFNQLDMPHYKTKEMLKEKLLMAINEGETGYGFG